ncbi:hypothetical protein ASZ90_003422 [hydrocarbon metagenome]|uniref:Uncharacterized protein n=1 Tax=hydrocarbon metagenome TaxID=938273 RepID=A0A0W8G2H5_9ZZZZ
MECKIKKYSSIVIKRKILRDEFYKLDSEFFHKNRVCHEIF